MQISDVEKGKNLVRHVFRQALRHVSDMYSSPLTFHLCKKEGEALPHPKCLHIGIILIVYVIQKSCAKILLFYEICNKKASHT